uniref:Uncharacterized protein n=1 Tax=Ailuropoda melanoleuca TaxID=9646 RepID=A0A7N5KI72_AILME
MKDKEGKDQKQRAENVIGSERESLCYPDSTPSARKHFQVPEWKKFSCW